MSISVSVTVEVLVVVVGEYLVVGSGEVDSDGDVIVTV